jgi:hypothetical protein
MKNEFICKRRVTICLPDEREWILTIRYSVNTGSRQTIICTLDFEDRYKMAFDYPLPKKIIGRAILSDEDTFDLQIGMKISYEKAIAKFYKHLDNNVKSYTNLSKKIAKSIVASADSSNKSVLKKMEKGV